MTEPETIELCADEETTLQDLQVYVCSICGEDHETENCTVIQDFKQVSDAKIPSRARLTLPRDLQIKSLADGTAIVVAGSNISQGTQFGPFEAPLSVDMHPGVSLPLKVFGKNSGNGYFLDTTDEESCNWMCLVAVATTRKEQNLICYDVKQNIYFTTTRDILCGEELRVWYALYYGLKLQALPLANDSSQESGFFDRTMKGVEERVKSCSGGAVVLGEDLLQSLAQHLPAHVLGASRERDVWICKLCGEQESNVASYARHLMNHYHQRVQDHQHFQCSVCLKRFLSKKVLERHVFKSHGCDAGQDKTSSSAVPQSSQFVMESLSLKESNHLGGKETVQSNQKELTKESEGGVLSDFVSQSPEFTANTELHGNWSANYPENQNDELRIALYSPDNKDNIVSKTKQLVDNSTFALPAAGTESGNSSKISRSKRNSTDIAPPLVESDEPHSSQSCGAKHINNEQLHASTSEEAFKVPNNQEGDQTINIIPQYNESLLVHSNDESSISSFDFGRTQSIDAALGSGAPITFIMVNSSDENGINFTNSSVLLPAVHESGALNEKDSAILDSSHQNPNLDSPLEKSVPYKCDICNKSFEKCSYLYRHLRKHTGEFTCVSCLAVFARKENLNAHSCSQPKEWFPCATCGKKFSAKKYLHRHTPIHTKQFSCPDCKKSFVSRLSLKVHRCHGSNSSSFKAVISCFLCERVFDTELKLQSHLKVHSESISKNNVSKRCAQKSRHIQEQARKKRKSNNLEVTESESTEKKGFICEICGATFRSSSSMKTHRFLHGERKFECEICKKRFHRKDVLQEHLTVHQEPNFPCQICGKKYKTKKSLYVHTLIHKGAKRFVCGVCSKEFFQKGNLFKHIQTHTSERMYTCQYCNKTFTSKEYFSIHELTHTQGKIYSCGDCKKSFVKKHMLDTHRQIFHSNRGFLCKYCNSVIRHKHSIRRHLERRHGDHSQEWSVPGFIDLLLADLPESLLRLAGETRLTHAQQQEYQQLLESFRKRHFENIAIQLTVSVELESTSDSVYSPFPPSEQQMIQLSQGDPLITLETSQQLTFIDNLLPDYDQSQPAVSSCQSKLISDNIEAMEGEVLLALVDQEGLEDRSVKNTPVSISTASDTDMIGLESGTTFLLEDGGSNNGVLLYVVETSNEDDAVSQDLVWCNDAVAEEL